MPYTDARSTLIATMPAARTTPVSSVQPPTKKRGTGGVNNIVTTPKILTSAQVRSSLHSKHRGSEIISSDLTTTAHTVTGMMTATNVMSTTPAKNYLGRHRKLSTVSQNFGRPQSSSPGKLRKKRPNHQQSRRSQRPFSFNTNTDHL